MNNLAIDLGRGLLIAVALLVFLWVIMGLGLLADLHERQREDDAKRSDEDQ